LRELKKSSTSLEEEQRHIPVELVHPTYLGAKKHVATEEVPRVGHRRARLEPSGERLVT
jgi:hypothetical protein